MEEANLFPVVGRFALRGTSLLEKIERVRKNGGKKKTNEENMKKKKTRNERTEGLARAEHDDPTDFFVQPYGNFLPRFECLHAP